MTRPSPAQVALARSTLPARRVSPMLANANRPLFANMLQAASGGQPASFSGAAGAPTPAARLSAARLNLSPAAFTTTAGGGPSPISRAEIVAGAQQALGVPYVWGGSSASGLDCSAFVSRAWGVARHTTDNLAQIARRIDKNDLQAGDALNLVIGNDPNGAGHVRLFDRWANADKTQMWVYEETPPQSVHHVINWDPSYQPMRRLNVTD